jgi:hypothetical protein
MRQDEAAVIGCTYRVCRRLLIHLSSQFLSTHNTHARLRSRFGGDMSASTWAIGYRAYLRAHVIDENRDFEVRNAVVVDWILDQSHEFDADHLDGQSFTAWLEAKYPIAEAVTA